MGPACLVDAGAVSAASSSFSVLVATELFDLEAIPFCTLGTAGDNCVEQSSPVVVGKD